MTIQEALNWILQLEISIGNVLLVICIWCNTIYSLVKFFKKGDIEVVNILIAIACTYFLLL